MKFIYLLIFSITGILFNTVAYADSCAVAGMYTAAYYQCKQYELQRQQTLTMQNGQMSDPCESPGLTPLERGNCVGNRGAAQLGRGLNGVLNSR
jgi:hypothetical protein